MSRNHLLLTLVVLLFAGGGMLIAATLSAPNTVYAQANSPTPPPGGFVAQGTPDASVIVIPPPRSEDPVDNILANPLILTPRPTLDQRSARIPENFLRIGTTAIVMEGPLNVRNVPNTGNTSVVLAQLDRGDDVTILALSPDLEWAFVDTRGPLFLQGWVASVFLDPFQAEITPFAPSLPDAAETGFTLRAQRTVNLRQSPVLFSERVGILPQGAQAAIVAVTNTYSWWKIEYEGTVGWVSGTYVFVEQPEAYSQVPIFSDFEP
jgi:uncharacterized protein YgiM (DUF1202 family)